MTVRPATPDDVSAVLPMVERLAALHEQWAPAEYPYRPDVPGLYRRWLVDRAADDRSVFLVAEREGRLVAFLVGTVEREIPVYRLREYGFIHDLWVDEAYRNEGVARQMVMLAIERLREIGVTQVRLDTAMPNEPARNLFKSCGFRPSRVEMLLEVDPETHG